MLDDSHRQFCMAVMRSLFDLAYDIPGYNEIRLNESHRKSFVVDMIECYQDGQYNGPYDIMESPLDNKSYLIKNKDSYLPWQVVVILDFSIDDD